MTMMVQFHPSASASASAAVRVHFFSSAHASLISHQRRRFSSSLHSQNPRTRRSSPSDWIYKWDEANRHFRPKQPQTILNYRISASASGSGGSTMDRIVEKLKKFGYMDDAGGVGEAAKETTAVQRVIEKGSVEDIFYVEDGMLPNARGGFSHNQNLLSSGVDNVFRNDGDISFPWEKKTTGSQQDEDGEMSKNRTSLAELTLPESELRRLRNLGVRMKTRTKIGGGGVTQAVVDLIREKWTTAEIVRLKIEGAPALNMKRMHEILERKTGGLVVWRSGTSVCLYRGPTFQAPSMQKNKKISTRSDVLPTSVPMSPDRFSKASTQGTSSVHRSAGNENLQQATVDKKDPDAPHEVKYEEEVDKVLDSLGPRYTDWHGSDPLPVDADLLPSMVPGYQPPFRILPYGVRANLSQKEATALRRLARILPPHFAVGRSRQLQGLAEAIVKLWDSSSIAKVALKRGVQLTTSERMAEDLKECESG